MQHVYRSSPGLRVLDGRQYELWTQSQAGAQGPMAAQDFGMASVGDGHGDVHMEDAQGHAVLTVRE